MPTKRLPRVPANIWFRILGRAIKHTRLTIREIREAVSEDSPGGRGVTKAEILALVELQGDFLVETLQDFGVPILDDEDEDEGQLVERQLQRLDITRARIAKRAPAK